MRIERMPFTVYDVLGYFFPGFMFLVFAFSLVFNADLLFIINISISSSSYILYLLLTFFIIVFSYFCGHILSLIASYSVEKLQIPFTGYPSLYLLKDVNENYENLRKCLLCKYGLKAGYIFGCILYMLPLFIIWSITHRAFRSVTKSFEKNTQEKIKKKILDDIEIDISNADGRDWFFYVIHYVSNRSMFSFSRLYNYVVIYGFLRNSAACFYAISILILLKIMKIIPSFMIFNETIAAQAPAHEKLYLISSILESISDQSVYLNYYVFFVLLSFASFVGFIKYNRRYSEEAIMAFLTPPLDKLESSSKD